MTKQHVLVFQVAVFGIYCGLVTGASIADKPTDVTISVEHLDFFEKEVRPLLVKRCFECHGGSEADGGLSLASASGWKQGGDSGPAHRRGVTRQFATRI